MRIGRARLDGRTDFIASTGDGPWYALESLGIAAPDLPAIVEQADEIRRALEAPQGAPLAGEPAFSCPVVRPSKVLAIALNYLDHIRETGAKAPERPSLFTKWANALTGPYEPIVVDERLTEQADYEVELGVVMGRGQRWVSEQVALSTVFGYCVANDVSARDWQRRDAQFARSKSFDTFCPIGPWITTADEVEDPQDLPLRSWVNGELRQDSSTKEMVFPIAHQIAYLSRGLTFEPGDVLLTGTPHGVGFAMNPPRFLRPGDTVACEVEGLGRIENPVVGPDER